MTLAWDHKDPDEVVDYSVEWAPRLGDDAIDSSTWIVPVGLTQGTVGVVGTVTTIWLSGGTLGTTYEIINRVVTTGGRTYDETITLEIKSR